MAGALQRVRDVVLNVQCALIGILSPTQLGKAPEPATRAATVPASLFGSAARLLNGAQWLQCIETRGTEQECCGWPLCAARPRARVQGSAALLQRLRGPQDAQPQWHRHHFCSTGCETKARLLYRVLPLDPLWLRPEAQKAAEILSQCDTQGPDAALMLQHQIERLATVVPALLSEAAQTSQVLPENDTMYNIRISEHEVLPAAVPDAAPPQRVTDAIEGYSPTASSSQQSSSKRSIGARSRTAPLVQAEDEEDDLDDSDLTALVSGQRPPMDAHMPTMSDFGLVYATLDGWLTEKSSRFLRRDSSSAASDLSTTITLPPIDGDVSSRARHVSVWALLKPHLSASLDAIILTHAPQNDASEPLPLDRSSLLRDIQNFMTSGMSVERDPLPLRSRHWRALAFLLLWAITKSYHPHFHDCIHAARTQELSWMTSEQRSEICSLLDALF